jgi:hypothetical protein
MLRSPTLQSRTASALNCAVNFRRLRFAIEHSTRIFARSGVSTKAGEIHKVGLWTVPWLWTSRPTKLFSDVSALPGAACPQPLGEAAPDKLISFREGVGGRGFPTLTTSPTTTGLFLIPGIRGEDRHPFRDRA